MANVTKDLGVATAYGYAKSKGYTGTEDEFSQAMLDMTTAVDDAQQYAQDAEDAKDDAQASAQSIEQSAQQIATNTSDIADLKEDLSRLDDLSFGIDTNSMPVEWFERGSITSGNNDPYRSNLRVRTKNILRFDSAVAVTVTQGQFIVFYYADDGSWISPHSGWKTSSNTVFIPKNQRFRIMATPDNDAPASVEYDVAEMVENVQFKLDAVQDHTINLFNMQFEHGALESGADNTFNQANRARTNGIVCLPIGISVSMHHYSYGIHFFDDDGDFTNNTAWRTTDSYFIPSNKKFRLVLAKDPNSSAFADLSELVNDLVITTQASVENNNPNIIYQCRNVDDTKIPPESKWYIRAAANNQYDRVRCTVRKTTEGYYFMCHDDYINNVARNSDGTAISSRIAANGRTLAELNTYDWGIKYGSKYAGAHVPMLEDFLKYAALFNLGVTWHSATALVETDADISNICEMFDQYGLTDNMIVISASGQNFDVMQKFKAHNPRISYYIGGEESFFNDANNIASIKALQTEYNKIYVQLYPWKTAPTSTFIALAKENNFLLYNSIAMSESDLLNINTFNKGYGLIEANNVYRIKDTVRNWANGLIN